jgi:hypothetical protein
MNKLKPKNLGYIFFITFLGKLLLYLLLCLLIATQLTADEELAMLKQ